MASNGSPSTYLLNWVSLLHFLGERHIGHGHCHPFFWEHNTGLHPHTRILFDLFLNLNLRLGAWNLKLGMWKVCGNVDIRQCTTTHWTSCSSITLVQWKPVSFLFITYLDDIISSQPINDSLYHLPWRPPEARRSDPASQHPGIHVPALHPGRFPWSSEEHRPLRWGGTETNGKLGVQACFWYQHARNGSWVVVLPYEPNSSSVPSEDLSPLAFFDLVPCQDEIACFSSMDPYHTSICASCEDTLIKLIYPWNVVVNVYCNRSFSKSNHRINFNCKEIPPSMYILCSQLCCG